MAQSSSIVTGGVTVSAATLVPLVTWALNGFPHPIPDTIPYLIAALIVTVGHALYNIAKTKMPSADQASAASSAMNASASTTAAKQAGRAQPILLALMALGLITLLPGCSLLPQSFNQIEEGAAQTVVQSSERTICRDIPIGTWIRLYGSNADRVKGWQAICFNPVTAPLNDATIQAILKVYPQFDAAVQGGGALPGNAIPPVPASVPNGAQK